MNNEKPINYICKDCNKIVEINARGYVVIDKHIYCWDCYFKKLSQPVKSFKQVKKYYPL